MDDSNQRVAAAIGALTLAHFNKSALGRQAGEAEVEAEELLRQAEAKRSLAAELRTRASRADEEFEAALDAMEQVGVDREGAERIVSATQEVLAGAGVVAASPARAAPSPRAKRKGKEVPLAVVGQEAAKDAVVDGAATVSAVSSEQRQPPVLPEVSPVTPPLGETSGGTVVEVAPVVHHPPGDASSADREPRDAGLASTGAGGPALDLSADEEDPALRVRLSEHGPTETWDEEASPGAATALSNGTGPVLAPSDLGPSEPEVAEDPEPASTPAVEPAIAHAESPVPEAPRAPPDIAGAAPRSPGPRPPPKPPTVPPETAPQSAGGSEAPPPRKAPVPSWLED